jgi:Kelch motif
LWSCFRNAKHHRFAAAVLDNKIYALGGSNNISTLNDVESYDPLANFWTAGPPMPTARQNFAATVLDGALYAVGGFNNNGFLNTVEIFTPVARPGDLRVLANQTGSFTVIVTGGSGVTVQRLTLEQPPDQSLGGGLNSLSSASTITLSAPLAPSAAINVEFLLGAVQGGSFRFLVNIEAAIAGSPSAQQRAKSKARTSDTSPISRASHRA